VGHRQGLTPDPLRSNDLRGSSFAPGKSNAAARQRAQREEPGNAPERSMRADRMEAEGRQGVAQGLQQPMQSLHRPHEAMWQCNGTRYYKGTVNSKVALNALVKRF
ncbi:hypothetical protein, partial [Pseudoxanthomonas winnipegensis]|uniref:hypothetical protein n=1 Tax=Pseudoxanthomonas winnipegensis TaxID=2480810 RepID=UPI00197EC969